MNSSRKPSIQEVFLLEFLISESSIGLEPHWKEDLLVESMKDGAMGSIYLFPKGVIDKNRSFGKCVSEYRFADKDGVEVIASLNLDDKGALFELDIWKTDFSPLISIPEKL